MYMKSRTPNGGFTLVELLVVIAIIALLAGILLPAMRGALDKADKTKALTEAKGIESAVRAYYTEYSKLPGVDTWQGQGDKVCTGSDSESVLNRLTTNNSRRIVFLEIPGGNASGQYLDPWGNQYVVAADYNYDGVLGPDTSSALGSNKLFVPVAAISLGPDGKGGNTTDNKDNIYSFQ